MTSIDTAPDLIARFLHDAARYPGGHAAGVVRPTSVEEMSETLRVAPHQGGPYRVLAVGAQSSLTGGATPFGDLVLSTERLTSLRVEGDCVHAGAGVTLQAIQDALAAIGRWLPPVPTYLGATAGGAVATCAAGAATFKYGTFRSWVHGLTVVLASGEVLTIERGQRRASELIAVPALRMPDVPKSSAGYFLAEGMDLVDLFIGSEGTLGVIAEVVFRTAVQPAARCHALVPVADESTGIQLVADLRAAAQRTWHAHDPLGIDIAAIEHLDARSIAVVREDGVDRKLEITLPTGAGIVLLIEIELSAETAALDLWRQLESARDADAPDSPLKRFCALLDRHGALDDAEIALPDDKTRAAAFAELREAVPAGVNRRVATAQQQIDPGIYKTAADMVVPFERFDEMMRVCRRLFAERGLDLVVWGHISDGNVHPNVIPRSADDVTTGQEAILLLGEAVIAMGGSPLAEHGVGRNPIKQELLRRLYGSAGIDAMRAIKRSLDPNGVLASGVVFPSA
ncbi:MAG: lactate dehydrogenase [Acidobacterium sp.]|nr:FAD-binding oxidoreductase [Acidobacteriota bacterium]PHY10940.1 MAG: lactate dehydrogenase [Acidobacterium sp.]